MFLVESIAQGTEHILKELGRTQDIVTNTQTLLEQNYKLSLSLLENVQEL